MDRQIVYPGAIPQDTDFLQMQRNIMVALGFANQAALGTTPCATGFIIAPTNPASLSVNVGPGAMTNPNVVDTLSFGSLPADTTDALLKMGISLGGQSFTFTPPTSAGQSQIFLIYATFSETQAGATVMPYVNAANPAQPFSGPGNDGVAQASQIIQRVTLQYVAGTPSATPSAPVAPGGSLPFYLVTLTYGQTAINAANITLAPGNPFPSIGGVLQLNNALATAQSEIANLQAAVASEHALSNIAIFQPTTNGVWTVPANVTAARVRAWAGGGAGGNGFGSSGGGGAGGGYAECYVPVTAGTNISIIVGNGGSGQAAGGGTSFGAFITLSGGAAGATPSSGTPSAGETTAGGTNTGSAGALSNGASGLVIAGSAGGAGLCISATLAISGAGGGAFGGSGASGVVGSTSAVIAGNASPLPGTGGAGGVGGGAGGQGGPGLVMIEW